MASGRYGPARCATMPWGRAGRPLRRDAEHPPRVGNAFELVHALLLEDEPGPRDEVLHRLRDQHLRGAGLRADPGADHDPHPSDLAVDRLELSVVDARADLE